MAKALSKEKPPAAVLEGDDVAAETSHIPIDLGAIFRRLDAHLRAHCNSALLAVPMPMQDRLLTPQFWIFEAQLVHGGSVHEIELVARARELGCFESFEAPLAHYYRAPPH